MEAVWAFLQSELFGQLIGFFGTAMVAIGMQCRSYNKVVFVRTGNAVVSALHYLLIGGYTGMAVNIASVMTNVVYWDRIRKKKSTLIFQIVFGTMFVALGFLSWQGPLSLLIIASKLISSVAMGINNTRTIRILTLINTPCWLVYDIVLFSVSGICSDILIISSVLAALIRIDIIGARREKTLAAEALEKTKKKKEILK